MLHDGCLGAARVVDKGGNLENMRNEFKAIVKQDGPWHIAYCAEVPGANGQGASREECRDNLREAIALVLEHRREEPPSRTPSR